MSNPGPAARVVVGVLGVWSLLAFVTPSPVQAQPPIVYTLEFPAPQTHYVHVEAVIPTRDRPRLELMMAVWTPGSYLVREFARHVEQLTARDADGRERAVRSIAKNRWEVDATGTSTITLGYRVYGREMSVRTNWIDRDFALINGAPTFITAADDLDVPHQVGVELPADWGQSVTALPPAPGDDGGYLAPNFDTLVDSPMIVGNPSVHEFEVDGIPHALVNVGDDTLWDGERAAGDVERIVEEQRTLFGSLPYDRYLFLNVITEAGGGLEHASSTVLMTSRWQMRSRTRYLDWLTLVSHELFHAWNGKRLRPIELGPFDYENEVHTRSLWVTEGVTVYYAPLLVHRAGLSTRDEYLAELSSEIRTLQTTPGRLEQSVEQASHDTWIKFYRPNENSRNTTVSYYTKGAVLGFLLDTKVRRNTGGARSLDDVMRLAFDRYAGARGFTPDEFRTTVLEVVGDDGELRSWLRTVLETTAELDYGEALDWYGMNLSRPGGSTEDDDTPPGWLGLGTRSDGSNVVVSRVVRATPGAEAGFNVDDEIVAIDGYRVSAADWTERLALYEAGASASVLVARRGKLLTLETTFGRAPQDEWDLALREVQTQTQPYRVDAWLGAAR